MRSRVFVLLAAAFGLAVMPVAAEAGHRAPRGWGHVQTVHHYGYYPRYHHYYHVDYRTDPYAYRWEPRGYYPYYNSGYWRPTWELRQRRAYRAVPVIPPYYQAWGHPHRYYHHRKWHRQHYGHHRHHHW